jgi:glucokinase
MFAYPVLIGDIGGTNARFAVVPRPGAAFRLLPKLLTASRPDPVDAIREALRAYDGEAPRSAMIAVANRVDSVVVRLTNADWTVDAPAIGAAFALDRVALVNDYPPVAACVTALDAARGDLAPIGAAAAGQTGARVVIGPGTGLGAAALLPVGERFAILASEGGHVEFGPAEPDEFALWPHLERVMGRVTAESVLSGPGLFRLAKAVARVRGEPVAFSAPNDVLVACRNGVGLATETLTLYARLLGRYAGDLALVFEATGGVFIAGGIAPRMVDILQNGAFREAFDRKAPHDGWARRVFASVITHPEPALLGLSALVAQPDRFVVAAMAWQR